MTKDELDAMIPAIVEEPPRRKKVAILGFTPSFKLAPFDDPEWEVWGLNELYQFIPRWDRWFEIHKREVYEADKKRVSDHVERLKAMTNPIYMQQRHEDIPGSMVYPIQEIVAMFGDYLTNSISYMMALVLWEKVKGINDWQEIGIYGVDMAHDTEYNSQRPSCEYFVGLARGMGIKVTIPAEADLLKANYLYGYELEEEVAFAAKLRAQRQELQQRLSQMDTQIEQLKEGRAQNWGALQQLDHLIKIWAPPVRNYTVQ